jgi:hypothetical protein
MSPLHEGRKLLQWLLSDNNRKHARINTAIPSQKEMDWVGVEPTTSGSFGKRLFFLPLSSNDKDDIIILISPTFQNNHLEYL